MQARGSSCSGGRERAGRVGDRRDVRLKVKGPVLVEQVANVRRGVGIVQFLRHGYVL